MVGLAFFASRLPLAFWRPSLAATRGIVRLAVPAALIVLASQLLANLDLWCLKWLGTAGAATTGSGLSEGASGGANADETVGFYVAATNIARLPSVIQFVMTAVLIPSVARIASRDDEAGVRDVVRGAFRFLTLLLLPVCAWLALRSEELMLLVYSEDYREGAPFQALLAFRFGLFSTLLMTLAGVLLALGKPGTAARGMLAAVPVGGVILVAAIRTWGATGAAIGALATLALGVLFVGVPVRRRIGPFLSARTLLVTVLATGAMTAVTFAYRPEAAWVVADGVLCLGVAAAVLAAVGELRPSDLAWFLGRRPEVAGGTSSSPDAEQDGGER